MGYDGAISNVWSCGVILYALLTSSLPFDDRNLRVLYQKASKGKSNIPSWLSLGAQNLIMRIFDHNPATRITIAEIKEDGWFNQDYIPSTNHDNEELEDDFLVKDNVFSQRDMWRVRRSHNMTSSEHGNNANVQHCFFKRTLQWHDRLNSATTEHTHSSLVNSLSSFSARICCMAFINSLSSFLLACCCSAPLLHCFVNSLSSFSAVVVNNLSSFNPSLPLSGQLPPSPVLSPLCPQLALCTSPP
ncbi:hypothetical protein Scep_016666 [Stephania cephalantha]|uniref:Protein kinase domain-containing protein n=1 Tax=Stephania cephalantha TaxID=152367 RepID=A0AAP0IN33_9MAGN